MEENTRKRTDHWRTLLLGLLVVGFVSFAIVVFIVPARPAPPRPTVEEIGEKVGEVGSKFAKGVVKGIKKEFKGN